MTRAKRKRLAYSGRALVQSNIRLGRRQNYTAPAPFAPAKSYRATSNDPRSKCVAKEMRDEQDPNSTGVARVR